jgi:hypothetical protein
MVVKRKRLCWLVLMKVRVVLPPVPLLLMSQFSALWFPQFWSLLKTFLALWVELSPTFWYRSAEFMGGVFLPPKRLEGTLIGSFGLVLIYLPFGSLGLFMKEVQKEKLPLGLGEPAITDAQVLTSHLKVPPPPN